MAKTTTHPTLGKLKPNDVDGWGGTVTLARFGKGKWPRKLPFHLPDRDGRPDPRGIALLLPLIEHSATLTDLILDGLWNELQGREKQNGHWWAKQNGLAEANLGLDEPMTVRDDLLRVLRPRDLFVRDDTHGDGELTAGVFFRCDFEEEHGLDVLTDGTRVLGTGYALDAEKYARFSSITPAERKRRHAAARRQMEATFKKTKAARAKADRARQAKVVTPAEREANDRARAKATAKLSDVLRSTGTLTKSDFTAAFDALSALTDAGTSPRTPLVVTLMKAHADRGKGKR